MWKLTINSKNSESTKALAARFTKVLKPGDVVLLTGDLGAGKTTFVGGFLNALGYKEHVVSPTFNILKCYFDVKPFVFHIDAYRLEDQNHDIGLEEFIEGNGITFIEWPKFIQELIPHKHLNIEITRLSDEERQIVISADDGMYKEIENSLKD